MKIKELLNKYFDAIETVLLLCFATGMVLVLNEMRGVSFWTIRISLLALTVLYWSQTVKQKDYANIKEKISEKFLWYSLILAPLSILSKLQFQDNANIFLLFSGILIFIAILYRIIERKFKKIKINEIIRAFIALIIIAWLYLLPLIPLN